MQLLVKLLMNRLYGKQIGKDIEDKFACKSDYWMMSEYDERVTDFWKISHGNYIVKKVDDAGLDDKLEKHGGKTEHHATSLRRFCNIKQ